MEQNKFSYKGKEYTLDRHGFLDPPDQWDKDFAEGMGGVLGIPEGLSDEHWKIINYLRDKFIIERTVPVVVIACAENKLRLNQLRTLFPAGYHRGACRIAGINYAFMSDFNIWLTYETGPQAAAEYKTDETGFLENFESWNERFAYQVAQDWNLPDGLTERHWKIIHYLRDYYRANKNIPTFFDMCRSNGIGIEEFGRLFPKGYRRGACRAAGLPFFA